LRIKRIKRTTNTPIMIPATAAPTAIPATAPSAKLPLTTPPEGASSCGAVSEVAGGAIVSSTGSFVGALIGGEMSTTAGAVGVTVVRGATAKASEAVTSTPIALEIVSEREVAPIDCKRPAAPKVVRVGSAGATGSLELGASASANVTWTKYE
jgi:hypothetical protein